MDASLLRVGTLALLHVKLLGIDHNVTVVLSGFAGLDGPNAAGRAVGGRFGDDPAP